MKRQTSRNEGRMSAKEEISSLSNKSDDASHRKISCESAVADKRMASRNARQRRQAEEGSEIGSWLMANMSACGEAKAYLLAKKAGNNEKERRRYGSS